MSKNIIKARALLKARNMARLNLCSSRNSMMMVNAMVADNMEYEEFRALVKTQHACMAAHTMRLLINSNSISKMTKSFKRSNSLKVNSFKIKK